MGIRWSRFIAFVFVKKAKWAEKGLPAKEAKYHLSFEVIFSILLSMRIDGSEVFLRYQIDVQTIIFEFISQINLYILKTKICVLWSQCLSYVPIGRFIIFCQDVVLEQRILQSDFFRIKINDFRGHNSVRYFTQKYDHFVNVLQLIILLIMINYNQKV